MNISTRQDLHARSSLRAKPAEAPRDEIALRDVSPTLPQSALASGVPSMAEYRTLIGSPIFRDMERYSNSFLQTHSAALAAYSKKWVRDPLHQWSRQWEYPYVFEQIATHLAGRASGPAKALDAGSGVTFFPYYLRTQLPVGEVDCVDSDASLASTFDSINRATDHRVRFNTADLVSLPFEDKSFQVVYCISVLEHTAEYPAIIREFARVLDDEGILVITFDVSIDGDCDITLDGAEQLLQELRAAFPSTTLMPGPVADAACSPEALTTRRVAKLDRRLLPWRHPLRTAFSQIRKGRIPKRWSYPHLTCCCGAFRKSGAPT